MFKPLLIAILILHFATSFSQGVHTIDTSYSEPDYIKTITYKTNNTRDSIIYFPKKNEGSYHTFIFKGNGGRGTWTLYSKEGYKTQQYEVSKNQRNGPCIYYFKNGIISGKEFYIDGLKEGNATSYYSDGKIKIQNQFKNNKAHGETKVYYKSGTLEWIGVHKNGKMHGKRIYFDEKGNLMNGPFIIRNEDGQLEREGTCIDGKPEGELKLYAKGELILIVNFKDGQPDGLTYSYKDGKIILTELYKNGKFKKKVEKKR